MQNTNSSLISLKTAFYKPFTDTLIRWYILNSVDCNTIAVVKKIYRKKFILLCMHIKIQFISLLWRYRRHLHFMTFTYSLSKLTLLSSFWNTMYHAEQNILRQLVLPNSSISSVSILTLTVSSPKMSSTSSYFMVDLFALRAVFASPVCS